MKKLFFILLSTLFAVNVAASIHEGTCGNNITWTYDDETFTLTLDGKGAMPNFDDSNDAPWGEEFGTINEDGDYIADVLKVVTIKGTITHIGSASFNGFRRIQTVKIESNVLNSFGASAFQGCSRLATLNYTVPSNLIVGENAFNGTKLITDGVLYLGSNLVKAYNNCAKELEIQDGTTNILNGAFKNNIVVTTVSIPNTVKSIGNEAFANTQISEITIPNSVRSIGTDVFKGTNLETVTFNANVSTFSNWFEGMSSLTSINIPSSVTKISNDAFNGCSNLSNITFGYINNIATFGSNIFKGCTSLPVVDGYRMAGNNIIVEVTNKSEKRYVISDDIVYIADGAFNGCDKAQFIDMYNRATAPKLGAGALAEIKNATTFVQSGHENNFPTNIWGTVNKTTIDVKSDKYTSCTFLHDAKIPAGIAVYKATLNGSSVSLTKLNPDNAECYIPARTGVLLRATKEKAGLNIFETASDNNTMDFYTDLTAVYEEDIKFTGNENAYILKTADGVQSFYKATNKNTATIGKCYLDGTKLSSAAKLSMFEEEDITGIEETVSESKTMDTQVFNMAGQKLSAPQKGLNIINGKKYIVK